MGEPGVLLAFEETAEELTTNMAFLGWDLDRLRAEGKLVVDHVKVERERIDQTSYYDLEALFIRIGRPHSPTSPRSERRPTSRCS